MLFLYVPMAVDKHKQRIDAARKLAGFVQAGRSISDIDPRNAYIHDKIEEAVREACKKPNGGNHFNQSQIEILTNVSFQVAYLLDPANHERSSLRKRLSADWKKSSLAEKFTIIASALGICGVLFTAGGWVTAKYASPDNSDVPTVEEKGATSKAPATLPPPTFGEAVP